MKKIQISLILLLLLSLLLCACDPGTYYFDYDDLLSNVVTIAFANLVNDYFETKVEL